ncbi:MAG: 16S rRNA (adenine(1518)-N(6)/adenine(1519)-N(6))-dimethyltransferase RsmA [Anaerolineales bacterium]
MANPRQLLAQYDLHPKKKLGQNFLHDPNALAKIVAVADVARADRVLEVGPGTGALTRALAAQAASVISIEIDTSLQPILAAQLAAYDNVSLVWQDVLTVDVPALMGDGPYKLVANLPYYITSAILRHFLENPRPPQSMTVMVQKQVAERIVAKPGDMSLLAVSVQYYGDPQIMMSLPPSVFWPRPDVQSAVVHMSLYGESVLDVPDDETFFRVVRAGFGQKRKQLRNALAHGLALSNDDALMILDAGGVDSTRRAETLALEEWAALARAYAALAPF